jgi:glycogen(starch) synthase
MTTVPLRVLMFGWEFPPAEAGGLATATLGLVKGLLRANASVTLVVPFPIERTTVPGLRIVSTARRFQRSRLARLGAVVTEGEHWRIWRVPAPLSAYAGAVSAIDQERLPGAQRIADTEAESRDTVAGTSGTGHVYGPNLMADVDRFADLGALLAEDEPHDVIATHDWITFGAGMRAAEASGRPMVAHIHATELDRSGGVWLNPAIMERERIGLRSAAHVISTSRVLARRVMQTYDVPEDRISIVPLGIDHNTQSWTHSRAPSPFRTGRTVLFLGRLMHQKAPDRFIEMARRVSDFLPETHFVIAGTGDLMPSVIERAAELGLADRVHFTGPLHGPDVRRAFGIADVCVMPSVAEPFGLVALESVRAGTPCIVPRDSGVAEVLRNVLKVDFWDIDEMANKVVAILRHAALHDELRDRGAAELGEERFELDAQGRATLAVYERVVRASAGALAGAADRPDNSD